MGKEDMLSFKIELIQGPLSDIERLLRRYSVGNWAICLMLWDPDDIERSTLLMSDKVENYQAKATFNYLIDKDELDLGEQDDDEGEHYGW